MPVWITAAAAVSLMRVANLMRQVFGRVPRLSEDDDLWRKPTRRLVHNRVIESRIKLPPFRVLARELQSQPYGLRGHRELEVQ